MVGEELGGPIIEWDDRQALRTHQAERAARINLPGHHFNPKWCGWLWASSWGWFIDNHTDPSVVLKVNSLKRCLSVAELTCVAHLEHFFKTSLIDSMSWPRVDVDELKLMSWRWWDADTWKSLGIVLVLWSAGCHEILWRWNSLE